VDLNVFETANAGFAQAVYEEYLRNPAGVSPEWRRLFERRHRRATALSAAPERSAPAATAPRPPTPRQRPSSCGCRDPAPQRSAALGPAARLSPTWNESLGVPTATTFREMPVAAEAHRARLNALCRRGAEREDLFTHLIGYAIVQAVKLHPSMVDVLATYDGAPHRVSPDSVGLGVAVDMERKDGTRGLVVPVVKAAHTMDFAAFHATYETLIEKARTNKLMPDDFSGGTIQLTNPGGLGTVAPCRA
jgi:2-oxoglutarate dehydrogenase E1 component